MKVFQSLTDPNRFAFISETITSGLFCQQFLDPDSSTWPQPSEVTLISRFHIFTRKLETGHVIIAYQILLFCTIKLNSWSGLYQTVKRKVRERTTWLNYLNISRWMCLVNVEISRQNATLFGRVLAPIIWCKATSFILLQKTQFVKTISQVRL